MTFSEYAVGMDVRVKFIDSALNRGLVPFTRMIQLQFAAERRHIGLIWQICGTSCPVTFGVSCLNLSREIPPEAV